MAVFSTNQNRQFYVVTKEDDLGKLEVITKDNLKQLFFKYAGKGGIMRSDLIDVDKVCYAKITKKEKLRTGLKKATITLNDVNGGKPIVGQDYLVRIVIHNYLAPGDTNVTIKHGIVHAVASMGTEEGVKEFYKKLADSLTMNFKREVQPLLKFKALDNGVEVTEVVQPYNVGFMSQETVNFEVIPTTVIHNGDDVIWATVDEKTGKIPVEFVDENKTAPGSYIGNGPKIADLEYFCMGERGDQYRDNANGWTKLPVKYMVHPESEYNVLDIHYFFSDTGVNVQKSEKDIIIVEETTSTELAKIKTALEGAGIVVQEDE